MFCSIVDTCVEALFILGEIVLNIKLYDLAEASWGTGTGTGLYSRILQTAEDGFSKTRVLAFYLRNLNK